MGQLVSLLVLSLRSRGEQALHDTRRASDGASFHAANLSHLDPHGGGPHLCRRMYDCCTLIYLLQRRNAHVAATSCGVRKQTVEHSGPTAPLGAPRQPVITKTALLASLSGTVGDPLRSSPKSLLTIQATELVGRVTDFSPLPLVGLP